MAEHNVLYVFFAGSTLNWLIMEVFRPGNYWGKLPEVSDGNVEICSASAFVTTSGNPASKSQCCDPASAGFLGIARIEFSVRHSDNQALL